MKRTVIKSDLALLDLEQASDYLAERSPRAALRFIDAAENIFERLATMPGIGTLYQPRNPAYDGIRYLVLSRFRKHVVFYRDDTPAVRIIRVIHGSRNIRSALDEALGIEEETDP